MKISMKIVRYSLWAFFLGALSLSAMETPSKYKAECERILTTDFMLRHGYTSKNIDAARAVLCMLPSQELTEAAVERAFKGRQAMFSGDKVQGNTSDCEFSEWIIRDLVEAADFLKGHIQQISLPKLIQTVMTSEDYDAGEAALRELPSSKGALTFLLNPLVDEDFDNGKSEISNRASYIEAYFAQDVSEFCGMLKGYSTVGQWNQLKLLFVAFPDYWALSVFDTSCKTNLMHALRQAQDAALDGVAPDSPNYAKKLGEFRNATEWLFRPWWVPQSVKLQYYLSTGIEAPKSFLPTGIEVKAVDQKNDGKAEIEELPQTIQEPFRLKIQQKPLCIEWQERKKKVRPVIPVSGESAQLPVIALGYTPLHEIDKKPEPTSHVPPVNPVIPGIIPGTPPSQVGHIIIEPVDNKPKAPAIAASQKGLFARVWDFAWKRPYTTCTLAGAAVLGGYYAVKNSLFSNWLGRARSSFGSGLGNIPQRR